MATISEALAYNISKLRKEKGLSQQDLADLIGVSRQSIVRYESGSGGITLDTIIRIAQVLQVEETDLVSMRKSDKIEIPRDKWEKIEKILDHLIKK